MKFKDVLKTVGAGLISSHPVGAAVLGAVNMFLPDDKKLPEDSTGEQVKSTVDKLPPEQKASLMEKEIDLEIAREEGWTERYKAMCKYDGQSTRPKIALMMAKVFCGVLLGFLIIIAYAVAQEGMAVLNQPYLWTIFATLTATPAGLLGKYFGELRKEQANRLSVSNPISNKNPISNLFSIFGGGDGRDRPPKNGK
ncbi:MAG: hypothetical protein K0U78_15245 [Actinomycetia bacterium]|nr:hypothetical protein [Actinomycetes bacterium]